MFRKTMPRRPKNRGQAGRSRALFECLEARELNSVSTTIVNGELFIKGSSQAETITLDHIGTDTIVNGKKIPDSKITAKQVTLDSGGTSFGGDIVNIRATRFSTDVYGHNGITAVNIGADGRTAKIKGDVYLQDLDSNGTVNVDNSKDTIGRTVTMYASPPIAGGNLCGIEGLAAGEIQYRNAFWDFSHLQVRTGSAKDVITVENAFDGDLFAQTEIFTGGGDDAVNVNRQPWGSLLNIHGDFGHDTVNISEDHYSYMVEGTIDIDNIGGYTSIVVDDSANDVAKNVTLSAGTVEGLTGDYLFYRPQDVDKLTLKGGSAGNTFTVEDTHTNALGVETLTRIETGRGDDKVFVQKTSKGLLQIDGINGNDKVTFGKAGKTQQIAGNVEVSNLFGFSAITIDDSYDTLSKNVTFDAFDTGSGRVTGAMAGVLTYKLNDVPVLTFNGGFVNDKMVVHSTVGRTKLVLNGGGGSDQFYIGNEGSSMDRIQQSVLANGESGTDYLYLWDSGSALPHSYVTYLDHVTRTGAAPIYFSHIEALDIDKHL